MSSGPRTPGPRHMAGGAQRFGAAPDRHPGAPQVPDADVEEVLPVLQVKRSRLAFALAVTVAALPILVLDNLPASAERAVSDAVEQVATDAPADQSPSTTVVMAPTTTAAPATTAPEAVEATEALEAQAEPTTTNPPASEAVASVRTAPAPAPAPTTTTTAAPPPPPASSGTNGDPNDPATWDRMAQCEAGGNWSINTGNGYYGGLQFSLATWQSYGGTGYPHEASKATQITIGKKLQAARGWGAWPGCARQLGYT